jgi:cell division protein FtsW (lipid II flippase)
VIGEELGFVGCALVVVFFLIFFDRGLRIADRTRGAYGTLLCAGLVTVMATQTFLNVGGVTKLIPLTGITLPFISQGGSSLLTAFASLGLLLAVSDGETARNPRKRSARGPSAGRATNGGPRPRKKPRPPRPAAR